MRIQLIATLTFLTITNVTASETTIKTADMEPLELTQNTRKDVDPERIGILGICGWGGFALNAAVLMIHGAEAHSRYFSEDAYKKMTGDNKELLIIPGANHVDLYDNLIVIPFDKMEVFFKKYLVKEN